jgi:N-acetylglucosamine kinase-like BadF-type ATPase
MKYFIGIDGGGTKTDCIITDWNYNPLFSTKSGPLNVLSSPPAESSRTIIKLINTCLFELKISFEQVECIGIGAAGAGRIEDANNLEKALKYHIPQSIKLKIMTDAEAALEGAFNGGPGSILISGTGSIIFGKDLSGKIYRCGGYGRIIGDEGSGYLIGKKGLITAAKEFDGRGEKSSITDLLKNRYKINSLKDIINAVYKNDIDIAALVPIILASAGNDDKAALKIIDEETDELIGLILCMLKKLDDEIAEICFSGSLISTVNIFSITLRNKLAHSYKMIKIKEPLFPPAMGAIFIAKER